MAEVNWSLLNQGGNNALDYFQVGQKMGQDVRASREKRDGQNALSAYALNPDAPGAFEGLAKYHPEAAIQQRQARE